MYLDLASSGDEAESNEVMRSGSKPADKPVGIFRAIRTRHRTTWRSPQFYVLVVGAMQLLVILIAIPMIRLLYRLVRVPTRRGSLGRGAEVDGT